MLDSALLAIAYGKIIALQANSLPDLLTGSIREHCLFVSSLLYQIAMTLQVVYPRAD